MTWTEVTAPPSSRTLRQFAAMCLLLSGIAALRHGLRADALNASPLTLAGFAVGAVGLIAPQLIRWVFTGAMVLAYPLSLVLPPVFAAVIFYGIITPVALARRAMGRDPLQLRRPRSDTRHTYWLPRQRRRSADRYFRQF